MTSRINRTPSPEEKQLRHEETLARLKVRILEAQLEEAKVIHKDIKERLGFALLDSTGLEIGQILTMSEPFYSKTKRANGGRALAEIGEPVELTQIERNHEGILTFHIQAPYGFSVSGVTVDELEAML